MQLHEELLRGIYAYGFEKPSAIQQRAIIPCVKGKCDWCLSQKLNARQLYSNVFDFLNLGLDVIAQAQSGTGKTATFSIAILQQIDTSLRECQSLILAPTRELAQQVNENNF